MTKCVTAAAVLLVAVATVAAMPHDFRGSGVQAAGPWAHSASSSFGRPSRPLPDAVATDHTDHVNIFYNDTIDTNGWIALQITGRGYQPNVSMATLYYEAGLLEGKATALRIWQQYVNVIQPQPNVSTMSAMTKRWIRDHMTWITAQAAANRATDSFWRETSLKLTQLQGIFDGYSQAMANSTSMQLSHFDLFVLNFQYELMDLSAALVVYPYNPNSQGSRGVVGSDSRMRTPEQEQRDVAEHKAIHDQFWKQRRGGCTALVKVTADDLFMAHTTWSGYNAMIRIVKDYDFANVRTILSGYPGLLHSGDDWYMLSSGLAVTETTNLVAAPAIYRYIMPQSVSEWLRVIVANAVGTDGVSWTNTYCRYNSGTYNNQYMVVDMNKYTPRTKPADLRDGVLFLAEQMPGMCPIIDVTYVLRNQSYWRSYNIPFLPEVYVESGTAAEKAYYGDFFSYTKYARAVIEAREQASVTNLSGVKKLIRYNRWQVDPASRCPNCHPRSNPFLSLASRGDLVPATGQWGNWSAFIGGPTAFGAIDAKITSFMTMKSWMKGAIISGPTYDSQAPFQWSTSPVNSLPLSQSSHIGQADLQEFPWVDTTDLFPSQ